MVTTRDIIECIFFALLVFLLAFGITAIVFGIMILGGNTSLQNDLKNVTAGGCLLVLAGFVLFPAVVVGILGAQQDLPMLLRVFAVLALAAVISESISIMFLQFSKNPGYARQWLETALDNYNSSELDRGFWEILQSDYKCCGVDGYGDWGLNGISLPESCCEKNPSAEAQDENESCKALGKDLSYVNKNGCHKELVNAQDFFCSNALYVKYAFLGCGVISVGIAWWLVCDILGRFSWW